MVQNLFTPPKFVKLTLVGLDGNAFSLMGEFRGNGVKYEIGGNKLYNDGGVLVTTLSEIDEQFEAKIKNEFNAELGKLEDTIHYLFGLVDGAKCAENLIATEHMLRIIKEANKKIKL